MAFRPPPGDARVAAYPDHEDAGAVPPWLERAFGLRARYAVRGAVTFEEPARQPHGDRRYAARDPAEHHREFVARLPR